jgi:hypothetical protein
MFVHIWYITVDTITFYDSGRLTVRFRDGAVVEVSAEAWRKPKKHCPQVSSCRLGVCGPLFFFVEMLAVLCYTEIKDGGRKNDQSGVQADERYPVQNVVCQASGPTEKAGGGTAQNPV